MDGHIDVTAFSHNLQSRAARTPLARVGAASPIVHPLPPLPPCPPFPSSALLVLKQRVALMASCWLRVAKRAASKRALTVALAFVLAFPSLNAHRFSGDGVAGGAGAGSAAIGGADAPAVELVLPSEGAAAERATAVAGPGVAQQRVFGATQGGGIGGTGRSAVSSQAAFVGPWGEQGSAQPNGVVAAAVRAPSRFEKKAKEAESMRESPQVALRSLVSTVGANGREIAEDFGGHIQVRRSASSVFVQPASCGCCWFFVFGGDVLLDGRRESHDVSVVRVAVSNLSRFRARSPARAAAIVGGLTLLHEIESYHFVAQHELTDLRISGRVQDTPAARSIAHEVLEL